MLDRSKAQHRLGERLVAASKEDHVPRWDLARGKPLRILGPQPAAVTAVESARDGLDLISRDRDGGVRLWDLTRQRLAGAAHGEPSWQGDMVIADRGPKGTPRILGRTRDGGLAWWSVRKGKLEKTATVWSFLDGTWAVTVPDGRYDASNRGQVGGLHWAIGDHWYPLSNFRSRFHRPGLLATLVGHRH